VQLGNGSWIFPFALHIAGALSSAVLVKVSKTHVSDVSLSELAAMLLAWPRLSAISLNIVSDIVPSEDLCVSGDVGKRGWGRA
jgi:hypothetical protein